MIDPRGIAIIKEYEGLRLTAYICPAGVPTIGYGHTDGLTKTDIGVKKITEQEADALLKSDLFEFENGVKTALIVNPNPFQLAAMVSLAFNIGLGNFKKSTVVKAHNKGDFAAAASAFNLWTKATVNGKKVVLPGLVSRRAREAALYLTAINETHYTPVAQLVEEPTPVGQTGTVRAVKATGVAVGLSAATDIARQVGDVAYSASPIIDLFQRIGPTIFFALLAFGALGYIWWSRKQQREAGKV